MTNLSSHVTAYLARHGIDAAVATEVGVRVEGTRLVYPNGRAVNVNGDKSKVRQPAGQKLAAWWPVGKVSSPGTVLVTEGESDALAAVTALRSVPIEGLRGWPVCSIPGVGYPVGRAVEDLADAEVVFLLLDADEPGRTWTANVAKALREVGKSPIAVELPDDTDLADCLAAAEHPGEWIASALLDAEAAAGADEQPPSAGIPADNCATVQPEPVNREAEWDLCAPLACSERILDRFTAQLGKIGLVGEDKPAALIYLGLTSRLLSQIVSIAVKGPSAGGKSFLVDAVLRHFPPTAYYPLTGLSERALAYSEEPLAHRHLVIFEAAGLEGEFASYLMRSLLSEGCVRYETVEKTKEGMRARLIERPGPTGLICTTTKARLHPENETRLLSLTVRDTPEQTAAVLLAIARENGAVPDLEPWLALQRWLEPREVTIPFAQRLAEAIPPIAVRLRRDFSAVLGLIRAHCLLHQATREEDDAGRLIATVEDYAIVRDLVADLLAAGIGAGVSEATRETVEAVERIGPSEGVTQKALAAELALDKSAVSRRVSVAIREGYMRNLEEHKGRPARLVTGDPLPDDVEVLPAPENLEAGCAVAQLPRGIAVGGGRS